MKKHCSALVVLAAPGVALAHGGHGLPGLSHWHATDIRLVLATVAVLGLWLLRRK